VHQRTTAEYEVDALRNDRLGQGPVQIGAARPEFQHVAKDGDAAPARRDIRLPEQGDGGVRMRVLAGSAYGAASPVQVSSPLFYVEVELAKGARLPMPNDHEERAAYVVTGDVRCGSSSLPPRTLVVLAPGKAAELRAFEPSRVMLLGGAPLDGPRYMFWNFVSSSKERIEQAARDWKAGKFPLVPGDEHEHIPLDLEPHFAQP